jgi:DNA sulfur modification protein DndD
LRNWKFNKINCERIIANKKRKEQLAKKIEVSDQHKAVDSEAARLNRIIQHFLLRFKDEKKKALEQKLENKLKSFLHKRNLVNKVVVDIQGNGADVDINLIDFDNKIIDKGNLSMGERQMFASALLGALVEETELAFPVFIDSPMQKFDTSHSQNILTQFYPKVSKQVILFPLLMKELTEEEYELIKPIVSRAYLIQHDNNASQFNEVNPDNLFEQYKNQ